MSGVTGRAGQLGNRAQNSNWLDTVARAGLVAYGVVHLLIAWLAVELAFGHQKGSASSQGAVQKLAHEPFGAVTVWLVAVGMLALVVWQGLEAVFGHDDEEGATKVRKRVTSAGKAIVYATIGLSAVRAATGSSKSSKGGTDSTTAKLMDMTGGQLLVGLVALGVLAVAGYLIYKGWTEGFVKQLDAEGRSGDEGKATVWVGKVGYIAKGIALAIVGILFGYAAISHDAHKSGGLDQALHTVLDQPFGPVLLVAIALGIGCYGVYCFARAKHFTR